MADSGITQTIRTAWGWFLHASAAAPIRIVCFTVLGMHVMKYAERSSSDPVLWIAFVVSLFLVRGKRLAWQSVAGYAAIAVVGWAIATIAMSVDQELSTRDFAKKLDVLAAAFAIPVLLGTRSRIRTALMIAALGWTIVLGVHLVEMHRELGNALVQKAHDYRPAAIVHANISSMIAGLGVFILAHAAWTQRARRLPCALLALGAALNVAYIYVIASRGPQIAFAATIVLAGFVFLRGRRALLIWAGVMAVGVAVVALNLEHINKRFENLGSEDSLNDRDVVWQHTLELSRDKPLTGHGYGKRVFVETYHNSDKPRSQFDFQHPHQYWIYVFFSQGGIGVVLHAGFWLLLFGRLLRARAGAADDEDRALIGLIGLLLVYIHVYAVADWPGSVLWVLLLWLVAIAFAATRETVDDTPTQAGS